MHFAGQTIQLMKLTSPSLRGAENTHQNVDFMIIIDGLKIKTFSNPCPPRAGRCSTSVIR